MRMLKMDLDHHRDVRFDNARRGPTYESTKSTGTQTAGICVSMAARTVNVAAIVAENGQCWAWKKTSSSGYSSAGLHQRIESARKVQGILFKACSWLKETT